ncbi:MAG: DUF3488 and transglutaminase-like domain-containing protein [bacterium]|nr:DUF3488 and transglutaminase-like domain-containing protein [bacterium]
MRDWLHPFLVTLTLLDLWFVGITGTVSIWPLAPLFVLACASPLLRQLRRFALYRTGWNAGVLIVFAMLVQHASTTGLLHMLEDGMLLAVLCQVHLLNNVGRRQRPDLVFFNSFLIAFVTSFFAPTVSWSALFVIHALIFVPALQLNVLARSTENVDSHLARQLLRDSLPRTAWIGAVTAVVFVFCPRDFDHDGWLGNSFVQRAGFTTGLAEVINLDNNGATTLDDRVVMRIESTDAGLAEAPSHWRGIAFSYFDGQTWLPQEARRLGSRFATDPAWERHADGAWRTAARSTGQLLRVRVEDTALLQVPLPSTAAEMRPIGGAGLLFDPRSYGGFTFFRLDDAPSENLEYFVGCADSRRPHPVTQRARSIFLDVPRRGVTRRARQLLTAIQAELPTGQSTDPRTLARACEAWLRTNRKYRLPGAPGFAGSIESFALAHGGGHCEFFATLLALMLRQAEIPCRLIGGYLAQERAEDGAIIIRGKHAHAWVEALMPDNSWVTLDATPAAPVESVANADTTWWDSLTAEADELWNAIVGFDEQGRARLLGTLAATPGYLWRQGRQHPFSSAALLALPIALIYARFRKRRRPLAVASLLATARALGIALRTGETPRELLTRVRATDAPADKVSALAAAVREHELARYGAVEKSQ